jgi:transposase
MLSIRAKEASLKQVFDRIHERVAGLDVHKAQVTAAVRVPGPAGARVGEVAEFATTVRGLVALRDWLAAHGVTHLAMEATGVYWKPVWAVLEDDFECLLVNARHVKQVPGRKTDVSDAAWIAQLLEAGLLRPSLVPPKPVRALRNLTRYRKTQIEERQREANRLHKILEDTGIKLDCVATDVLGASGRAMLDALCSGTTDPEVLAELAKGRLRQKIPALREALEGRFDSQHALIVGAILAHLDFLDEQIDRLSDAIEEQIRPFEPAVELLCTIPGVQRRTAEVIVAETGADMSAFPSPKHLASWAGQPPATTSRRASGAPAAPARDRAGSGSRSPRPRSPPSAPKTPTCKPNTDACARAAAASAPSEPSATRSSPPPGTCSPPASSTATPGPTTSTAAGPPSDKSSSWSTSSKASVSASRWSRPPLDPKGISHQPRTAPQSPADRIGKRGVRGGATGLSDAIPTQ